MRAMITFGVGVVELPCVWCGGGALVSILFARETRLTMTHVPCPPQH